MALTEFSPAYNARLATLRRILKYAPAVVLGLLVVAWMVSWFVTLGIETGRFSIRSEFGEIGGDYRPSRPFESVKPIFYLPRAEPRFLGQLTFTYWEYNGLYETWLPLPLIITALLPLAVGPLLSFRFRVWHYLAYTALVAIELAYYLRWQE